TANGDGAGATREGAGAIGAGCATEAAGRHAGSGGGVNWTGGVATRGGRGGGGGGAGGSTGEGAGGFAALDRSLSRRRGPRWRFLVPFVFGESLESTGAAWPGVESIGFGGRLTSTAGVAAA